MERPTRKRAPESLAWGERSKALGVPIRVPLALPGLAIGLEAVVQLLEQTAHGIMTDAVAQPPQFLGQVAGALARPQQGDWGSPRVAGPSKAFRSRSSPGSC
jgi:hypothetical protein